MDQIEEYLVTPSTALPCPSDPEDYWVSLSKITLPSGKKQFDVLGRLAIMCLSLPHSNADPERCFSVLRKIKTDSRSRLSSLTVHNLLSTKFNNTCECMGFQPTVQMVKLAKSCCNPK